MRPLQPCSSVLSHVTCSADQGPAEWEPKPKRPCGQRFTLARGSSHTYPTAGMQQQR